MDVNLFDYELPEALIAQYPAEERDGSRLLVVNRASGRTEDRVFRDLPSYLRAGDVLVFNNSRVARARLIGVKNGTGARIELFLTKRLDDAGLWETLARPAKRLKVGDTVLFGAGADESANGNGKAELTAEVAEKTADGFVRVRFSCADDFDAVVARIGHIPLPPYIRREDDETDAVRYQTVYSSVSGSAAAPTAGLHFTDALLAKLRGGGVETVFVTLHVGLGTFQPVKARVVEEHHMHTEDYYISGEAARAVNRAREDGRRIICVGTTSLRAIESAARLNRAGNRRIGEGWYSTDIFFYPGGMEFFMADALITNFHLPKSTLLMLVSAFYDRDKTLEIYRGAVEKKYRFFSYGDAMLIL